jgi:hypothetical protein
MKALVCSLTAIFTLPLLSADSTKLDETMVDTIKYAFETKYSHLNEKAARYGFHLDDGIEKLRFDLKNKPERASYALRRFFAGFNDCHVAATFWATELAYLPFEVKECNGRYFVVEENYSGFWKSINVGYELTHWNGKPIADVINKFLDEEYCYGFDNPVRRELGVSFLTYRSAEMGMQVPKGDVTLTFKKPGLFGGTATVNETWRHESELVPPYPAKKGNVAKSLINGKNPFAFVQKCAEIPYVKTAAYHHRLKLVQERADSGRSHALGSRRGFVPMLGTPEWKSYNSDPFFAYTFTTPSGKKVGYIRIGSYGSGSKNKKNKFSEHISRFQKETDMLVIDQLNNPGGIVVYCLGLMSHLSTKPLMLQDEHTMITDSDLYYAAMFKSMLSQCKKDDDVRQILADHMCGFPLSLYEAKRMSGYSDFLQAQWKQGKTMTDPYPFLGLDRVRSTVGAYDKPILLLINRLDVSCGDIFPAVLQDNKRAVLMGQTTAGAGATVSSPISLPNRLGLDHFNFGVSQVLRSNGELLEDNGVRPDVPYEFTVEDYQNDYSDYVQSILQQIDVMLGQLV